MHNIAQHLVTRQKSWRSSEEFKRRGFWAVQKPQGWAAGSALSKDQWSCLGLWNKPDPGCNHCQVMSSHAKSQEKRVIVVNSFVNSFVRWCQNWIGRILFNDIRTFRKNYCESSSFLRFSALRPDASGLVLKPPEMWAKSQLGIVMHLMLQIFKAPICFMSPNSSAAHVCLSFPKRLLSW